MKKSERSYITAIKSGFRLTGSLILLSLLAHGTGTLTTWDGAIPENSEEARRMVNDMLATSPEDPLANVVYGLWQFADLAESNEFQTMLVSVGIPAQIEGKTVFESSSLPDLGGFELNTDYSLDESRTYMTDSFLPVLDSLDERFSTLEKNQIIAIDKEDLALETDLRIDYADMLLLRAAVKAYAFWTRLNLAYGADPDFEELTQLEETGQFSVESIRDSFSGLGAVYDATILSEAGQNLQEAIDLYQEASPLLWESSRNDALFILEAENLDQEAEFSDYLAELEQALQGELNLKYVHKGQANVMAISLKPLFLGKVDLNSLLPDSIGNQFADNTFEDPTFGGLVPNMTDSQLRQYAESASLLSTKIWQSATPLDEIYWWDWDWTMQEVSGHWWKSHWFGFFYKQSPQSWYDYENRNFPDSWLYHLNLGWIHTIASTPKNIWFWKQDTNQWIWASSSFYPILYDYASARWLLLTEKDGSIDFWNGSAWEDI